MHRFGYYLLGLAIGLMIVGTIVSLRGRYVQPQTPPGPQSARPVPADQR